jgi:hypothetical protein
MIPTTVRIEIVGTMVSVIAGGPSKKISSGARETAALVGAGALELPFLFPRFACI